MKYADIADFLNTKEVNKTFDILYSEKSKLFTNQDDIYNAIIESSMKVMFSIIGYYNFQL